MARYRCPSSSYEDIAAAAGQTASSSKTTSRPPPAAHPAKNHDPVPAPRTSRKPKDKGKASAKKATEDKVKRQARVAQKKEQIRASMKAYSQTYIYVGNLSPEVTDTQLEEVFSVFGTVRSITVRSARGCPRTVKPGSSKGKERQLESRMYASVVYKEASSVHRVMEVDGMELAGQKVVIVRDALDLPEFKEIISGYTAKLDSALPTPSAAKAVPSARRAVATAEQSGAPVARPQAEKPPLQSQYTAARIAYQFRSRAHKEPQVPSSSNTRHVRM